MYTSPIQPSKRYGFIKPMKRISKPVAPVVALVFFCAFTAKAVVPLADLPDISLLRPYAEFGNQESDFGGEIFGDVGVSSGGNLQLSSYMSGNVFVASGATVQGRPAYGTVFTDQNLTATQNQVFSASSAFSRLPADRTFSTLTSDQSFSAPAGTALVVDVTNLDLINQYIDFSGSGDLVLNVSGSFNLEGIGATIFGDYSNVFVNYTGSSTLQMSGGAAIAGALFIPTADATLGVRLIGDGLYAGTGIINLESTGAVSRAIGPVPEGPTAFLLAVVGLFTGCTLVRRTRRTRRAVKQALSGPRRA
jgi:hypothetical protein